MSQNQASKPKCRMKQQQQDEQNIQAGFRRTCGLYESIDDDFISIWSARDQSRLLTEEWIINKLEALGEQQKLVDATCPQLCSIQCVDLISTCQWLRLRVWQMATWKYLLSSAHLRNYDTVLPLAGIVSSHPAMGVLQKIYEIVDIASDILTVAANFTLSNRDFVIVGQGRANTCQLMTHLRNSGKLDDVQLTRLGPRQKALQDLALQYYIMEGYDRSMLGQFYGFPAFKKRFGSLTADGTYEMVAAWQAGLSNGALAGSIIGLLFSGYLSELFGYRARRHFLMFFAINIEMLQSAYILAGLPWGVFQTITTTYAAEVCPVKLRPILTAYVNMCWVIGQLIASGVLRS
ncbi:hypothetical protein CEP54_015169, partial [Fusarium duplospermum]